jgi:streptogramin lyase
MKSRIFLAFIISFSLILLGCGGGGGGGSASNEVISENPNNENNTQFDFIQLLDENYTLKQVWETKLGIPCQSDLLPSGDVVVGDPNYNRISIISNNNVEVAVNENDINGWAVCSLPDGRICYSTVDGKLFLVNPETKLKEYFSSVPDGGHVKALASDEFGNVYAASSNLGIFRFDKNGFPIKIVDNLPYENKWSLNDIDVDNNGNIYVTGWRRVIKVDSDGVVEVIVDNLLDEPVWVEVGMDESVYINETKNGLRKFNPIDNSLEDFNFPGFSPFSDIVFSSLTDIVFNEMTVFYKYNITTNTALPLLIVSGNSPAFAVNHNSMAFFATPGKPQVFYSYIKSITLDGSVYDYYDIQYSLIHNAFFDKENLLCLSTNEGFIRIEIDNSSTTIIPKFDTDNPPYSFQHSFAIGPNNKWYVISSDHNDLFTIYSFDDTGQVEVLPLVFNKATFGEAQRIEVGNIDINNDGLLAIIVTAVGSIEKGPFYQRVYTANSDGTGLQMIANFDSERIGGPVDIAFGKNNDLYVLSNQNHGESIYKINHQNNIVSEFIRCDGAHDPMGIDADPNGNIWITTTKGIFVAVPND